MARQNLIKNTDSYDVCFDKANDNFIELYNNIADIFPFRGTIPANATIDSLKQGTYIEYGTKWNNRPPNTSVTNYAIITVEDTRGGSEVYKHIKYLNSESELFEKFGNSPWFKVLTDIQPNWITATLQNGWTGTLQYRKNNIGQLEIEAVIKSGTTNQGTVITTLPVGYRPYIARVPLLSAIGDDLSGGLGIVLADDGKIMVTSAAAGTSYTSNWYINVTINHLQ